MCEESVHKDDLCYCVVCLLLSCYTAQFVGGWFPRQNRVVPESTETGFTVCRDVYGVDIWAVIVQHLYHLKCKIDVIMH